MLIMYHVTPNEFDDSLLDPSEERLTPSNRNANVSNETLRYIKYRKDGVVEAATLPTLVDRLIHPSSGLSITYHPHTSRCWTCAVDHRKDLEFRETFLASCKAFTNAEEVFNLLIERFHAASSQHHAPEHRASIRYSWAWFHFLAISSLWLK